MKGKLFLFFCILPLILISVNFVSAVSTNFGLLTSPYINRTLSANVSINVTALSLTNNNVSNVTITFLDYPMIKFVNGTDATSAASAIFVGNDGTPEISFRNNTAAGIIGNGTSQIFNFSVVSEKAGITRLLVKAGGIDGTINSTEISLIVNFAFSAYVLNETGQAQNAVNVTIYQFLTPIPPPGQPAPPFEMPVASVLTDASGFFSFASINGSAELYTLKLVYSEGGTVKKVGPILPPFPATLFYPMPSPPGVPECFKPPVMNGTKFYLQPAATLRLNATNGTTSQKFGYEIIDQAIGFPIESKIIAKVSTADVVVPAGRNYTVMMLRDPSQFLSDSVCIGAFMNDTHCPTPPKSNSTLHPNGGDIVQVTINLTMQPQNLFGCINIASGHNNSAVNVTSIIPKLVPWKGFVPPVGAGMRLNLSDPNQLNYSDSRCPGQLAFYNISLIGGVGGVEYLLEVYAKNASNEAGNPRDAWNLAAFENVTIGDSNVNLNVTLKKLVGSYHQVGAVNTSKMLVRIVNSSQSPITTNMHLDMKIKRSGIEWTYIIGELANGTFYIPILNDSTWAKVFVFPNEGPPVERTLNLSLNENNITVIVGEIPFRRIDPTTGQPVAVNITDPTKFINMTFYRYNCGDNLPNPPEECVIARVGAKDFNPMTLMFAGKANLELKFLATGTTLFFVNFDLLSAKPPTNSIINENASSITGQTQIWEAGSFVPDVYDAAYVGMPYNDTAGAPNYINESYSFSIRIPYLKNENWQTVWNRSAGNTIADLPDEFIEYNSSEYRDLLDAGVACSTTSASAVCFMNQTENKFWLKVPHFSGIGSSISGSAPAPAAVVTPGGGAIPTEKEIQLTAEGVTEEISIGSVLKFMLKNVTHKIKFSAFTSKTATFFITSPLTITLAINETKEVDVDEDGKNDIIITLHSIDVVNATVSITVKSIVPVPVVEKEIVPKIKLCGNNVIDAGENCENCPEDVKCAAGEECKAGVCVKKAAEVKVKKVWWPLTLVIVIIVIIIIIIIVLATRKKK